MIISLAKNLLLSIITVVRNDGTRLVATMNSLANLYGDHRFEHIVIDGKSTDQLTLNGVLAARRHNNYKYISEPDAGIYDAMNKGVHLAEGRFLLFLNCGDRMAASPKQLVDWLKALSEIPDVDVGCFSYRMNLGDHRAIIRPLSGVQHKMPTSHQAMVFSREFMCANPYDIQYSIAADFDLYLSAKQEQIQIVDGYEPLTDIEASGVASESPVQSYKEYLRIAYGKLRGPARWIALARIGFKGAAVICLKRTVPRAWVHGLQRLIIILR